MKRTRAVRVLMASISFSVAPSAMADGTDSAAAELMFQQGRDLLRAGRIAEACPKLAESQRLDPASGTLMALALCHEAEGKLASAWAEFVDVEARSRNDNRADRAQVAHEHAEKIHPRLSTLEIRVPASVAALPGLEVRRNGVLLGPSAWNTSLPIDGGAHVVEVTAPGKLPWKGTAQVAPESASALVSVPELQSAPAAKVLSSESADAARVRPWGTLEWTGVGVASAGVVALGVGGAFLANALSKKSASEADCSGNLCGPDGYADRSSAVTSGNVATVLGVTGGVLLAGGATLFIYGRTRHPGETAADSAVNVGVGPSNLSASFSTHF